VLRGTADVAGQRRASLAAIACFALVAAVSARCNAPPPAAERNAPAGDFSAARAFETLTRILGDGQPHPTGSAANAAVRDRILAEFERLGYRPEVRTRFVCSEYWPVCATVDNVVAYLPGTGAERAVLLAAHYDSVAAGPGAGDDGAGIAAMLEVARALKDGPPPSRSIWFLAGDGEEAGLLDAEAFVREPEFSTIGSVVNLEARGTGGPSQLFETHTGNAAIVSLAGAALPHPVGSSLAYEIYRYMPNNTDFTVFRRAGLAGVNFAFTRGPARYHTPRDNLGFLDPASLQHHGENALSMVRALAQADARPTAAEDRVFFDLFGTVLVHWPGAWNPVLLLLGTAGWLLLAARLSRRSPLPWWRLVACCMLLPLTVVAALLVAIGLQATVEGTATASHLWTAPGGLLAFAFMALPVTVCAMLAHPLMRWAGRGALALASLFSFIVLACVSTALLPGTAFLATPPLLVGVIAGHAWPSRPVVWSGAAALAAVALWIVPGHRIYEILGFTGLPGVTLALMVALLPLLPAVAGAARSAWRPTGLALLWLAGLLAASLLRPAFTDAVPRPLNLLYAGNAAGGRLFTDAVPADERPTALMTIGRFENAPVKSLPWSDPSRLAGRAGPPLRPPVLTVLQDTPTADGRRLRLKLQTRRNARGMYLVLPHAAKPGALHVQGSAVTAAPDAASGWWEIEIIAPPASGVVIGVYLQTRGPVTLYAADYSDGLPSQLGDVVAARDAVAVPVDEGDRAAAWIEVRLAGL
jgi:hypothetical protein